MRVNTRVREKHAPGEAEAFKGKLVHIFCTNTEYLQGIVELDDEFGGYLQVPNGRICVSSIVVPLSNLEVIKDKKEAHQCPIQN